MKAVRLSHKALILVALPLAFQIIFVATLAWLLHIAEAEALHERRSKAIISAADDISQLMHRAALELYMYKMVRSDKLSNNYVQAIQEIGDRVILLKTLPCDDEKERRLIPPVIRAANAVLDLDRRLMYAINNNSGELDHGDTVVSYRIEMLSKSQAMVRSVSELAAIATAASRHETEEELQKLIWPVLLAGVVLNSIVAVALAVSFNRSTGRRIDTVMDNVRKLGTGAPLNQPLQGSDEIGQIDAVFHKMTEELRQAQQMKQEFVSMIGHDLRTPLMSVQTGLTLMSAGATGELPERALRTVDAAEKNLNYVIGLINNLLDLERMSTGKIELYCSSISVSVAIRRAFTTVEMLAENKNITLEYGESDLKAMADEERLVQVLINLLSNAIKFSPSGSTIEVTAEEKGDAVRFSVSDQGRGLPNHMAKAIFERFQQVNKSDAKIAGGSGLGLAICKSIIDAHNGAIGVESEEGHGSTFWFTVPKEARSAVASVSA